MCFMHNVFMLSPGKHDEKKKELQLESTRLSGDHTYKATRGLGVYVQKEAGGRRWVCILWYPLLSLVYRNDMTATVLFVFYDVRIFAVLTVYIND